MGTTSSSAPRSPARARARSARKERVVAAPRASWMPIVVDDGEGALVTDVDGNTFIDFAGGIGCLNVGHSHPRVSAAVQEQVAALPPHRLHDRARTSPTSSSPSGCWRAADPGPTKAGVLQLRRRGGRERRQDRHGRHGRPAVIAYEGAFHGRTHMAMSLTSKPHPYKAGFGPFAPEVYRVPFPNAYRWPGPTPPARRSTTCGGRSTTRVAAETVAAIVIEPVQGEGGFVVRPAEYLRGLREICDEHGIVLDRRRGADRLRPHRAAVRDRALRRRARPGLRREVDRRRPAALRRARARGDHGRARATRRSAARTSATRRLRRRARGARRDRRRGPARARQRRSASAIRSRLRGAAGAHAGRSATCAASARCSALEFVARPGDEGAGAGARDARRRARRSSAA